MGLTRQDLGIYSLQVLSSVTFTEAFDHLGSIVA